MLKKSISISLALCALLILGVSSPLIAGGFSIASGAGMGGAHLGLARGAEAIYYNPANLGLASHRQSGIWLAGVGVNLTNNSFTLNDYNKYTGATLSTEDKEDILSKVPVEGLILNADAEASAAGISTGQFAISISGLAASELNLGHELLDLLLFGNSLNDTISLDGMYGSGWSYASVNFAYGMPVYTFANRQLAVGATFHYLHGLYFADVTRIEGQASTQATGFAGDGAIIARTAEGGSGYALDLGAALQLNKDYTIGVNITNFVSSIKWDKNTEEHGYIFNFDSLNIENSGDDSVVISNDYDKSIDAFSESLPSTIRAGVANTTGRFLWAVDWEQGFKRSANSSAKPQISMGAEYHLIPFLPVRAGYSFGGRFGSSLALGAGVHVPALKIDAAFLTSGGGANAYGSKGARFALSTALLF